MRRAGLLMPVASLPSDYGIGDFGRSSFEFIDFLWKTHVKIWQILPLNPLGYGESPYQPYSSMAGDELYIDLEQLFEEGLLKECPESFLMDDKAVQYQKVRKFKGRILQQAFKKFVPDADFMRFVAQEWVYLYAVYITFKKKNGMKCWNKWKTPHKDWILNKEFDECQYEEDLMYEMFVQYMFYRQWTKVKKYANDRGVEIMGDIPFYVGIDSLDVWARQNNFLLKEDGEPEYIAGVPPDYFSKTGQRWGNPIYDWDYMRNDGYSFWMERLRYVKRLFDIVRIDHFRAFDTYWKIPEDCLTASGGIWMEAPGYEVFDRMLKEMPDIKIVAEDLGDMRQEVYNLRDHYKIKGMKIVQFAFDPNETNNNFPDRENMVIYTGSHDNETIRGWYRRQPMKVRAGVDLELRERGYVEERSTAHKFIRYTLDSIAEIAVIPIQDILGLGNQARLNVPGTQGPPNWCWRLNTLKKLERHTEFLRSAIARSGRA